MTGPAGYSRFRAHFRQEDAHIPRTPREKKNKKARKRLCGQCHREQVTLSTVLSESLYFCLFIAEIKKFNWIQIRTVRSLPSLVESSGRPLILIIVNTFPCRRHFVLSREARGHRRHATWSPSHYATRNRVVRLNKFRRDGSNMKIGL